MGLIVAIDPGTITGVAVFDRAANFRLVQCYQSSIVKLITTMPTDEVELLCIEDPNKRKWFGEAGKERLQGAGSVKRDFAIWKEYAELHRIDLQLVAPKNVPQWTQTTALFNAITNWPKKVGEHARDAVGIGSNGIYLHFGKQATFPAAIR